MKRQSAFTALAGMTVLVVSGCGVSWSDTMEQSTAKIDTAPLVDAGAPDVTGMRLVGSFIDYPQRTVIVDVADKDPDQSRVCASLLALSEAVSFKPEVMIISVTTGELPDRVDVRVGVLDSLAGHDRGAYRDIGWEEFVDAVQGCQG